MEMEKGVWKNLPNEIALYIVTRLLPRRSLYRLRSVWKEWNEMLSSYAALQRIHPDIHRSHTCAFLFQLCPEMSTSKQGIKTWVMEGGGDFYKVSDKFYRMETASNTVLGLFSDFNLLIFHEKSGETLKCIPNFDKLDRYYGFKLDYSTDQFIFTMGRIPEGTEIYDSSSDFSSYRDLIWDNTNPFWVSGRGVYHRGSFYWLDHVSCNGEIVKLDLSDSRWTKIPPPRDSIYRHSDNTHGNFRDREVDHFTSIASVYWDLAGNDVGELILVDKEYGIMWKLRNEEEILNSNRWWRVDLCLPREIRLVSVNNSGSIMVAGPDGINVYDANRRLARKLTIDAMDLELANAIVENKIPPFEVCDSLSMLPFECTYIWWPWEKNVLESSVIMMDADADADADAEADASFKDYIMMDAHADAHASFNGYIKGGKTSF